MVCRTGTGDMMKKNALTCSLQKGFTLIELIIVMAIVSLLLTLAAPRYFKSIERSKETVLRANLAATRDALDKYYGDTGKYPDQLTDLVDKKYLRTLPWDPVTESSESWSIAAPEGGQTGSVYNIFSGAQGIGSNNIPYAQW
jgi:general secretion pathway protein G